MPSVIPQNLSSLKSERERLSRGAANATQSVKIMTFDFSKFYSKSVLSVILSSAICTAQADSLRTNTASARVVSKDVVIILTEQVDPTGNMEREFSRGTETLYRSRIQPFNQGFSLQVVAGHPSQLGTLRLERNRLSVLDSQGKHLWSEELTKPLCLPEFIPEFIKAHWDRLTPGREPLACGSPIIKARKIAPVEWVRLPDGPRGERLVELRPGSLGMWFFLRPTRFTFSADGNTLIMIDGQFDTTPDPKASPSYLKGSATYSVTRQAQSWPVERFGPLAR
jgi:hypothetical protein